MTIRIRIAGIAAGFAGLLSLFNIIGRFFWASLSDYIGRKPIYMVYLGVGIVLYVLLALTGSTTTAVFVLLAGIIISFYGGGFATVPAYLRDLFRVFPHWPRDRYLELAPRYWLATRARLDPDQLERELGPLDVPPPPSSEQPAAR